MLSAPRNLLKPNASTFDALTRIADPTIVVVVGWAAHWVYLGLYQGTPIVPLAYWIAIFAVALCSVVVFPATGLYRPERGASLVEDLRALVYGWLTLVAVGVLAVFATKTGDLYSRAWVGLWIGAGLLLQIAMRLGLRLTLRGLRRRGYNLRHICIVGAGDLGREVVARLRRAPWTGLHLRGFYDDTPELTGGEVDGVPVLGTIDQLSRDLEQGDLDQVWIALPLRAEERIHQLVTDMRAFSVQVRYVPDIFGFQLLRHSFSEVAGMPVIGLTDTPMEGVQRVFKAVEDFTLGGLALLVLAPLLLALTLGVKLSSPGPVLYRQQRVTWNGRHFTMLKFRSMQVGAERASGPVWSQQGDARTTRYGAWLRRYSLDELPQLVKAGITGWAQVNDLRGSSDLSKRIQYDLYYIDKWSLWFDLRILALTVWHVFKSRNAH
jgi:putative colanic acid biosynthesis UDP-glucose lipid carrier transferase